MPKQGRKYQKRMMEISLQNVIIAVKFITQRNLHSRKENDIFVAGFAIQNIVQSYCQKKNNTHLERDTQKMNEKKRRKAREIFNHYMRDNHLERQPCEVCGAKAEAHHDDYDKPLEVRWLCFKHHREWHKTHDNPELLKGE